MHRYSSLAEIQNAVDSGVTVFWSNQGYKVIKNKSGELFVQCQSNKSCWGLTDMQGNLQDRPEKFFSIGASE